MRQESKEFLEKYINNASPTGFEEEGQKLWLSYIRPYVETYLVDVYGTVAAVINPKAKYKVAIEAHADEISWFVSYITDDGYIYLKRNGGVDHQIAPSMRVNIHGEKGIVKAVFGWPAIHIRDREKEEKPSVKNLFLDCGCESKEEVLSLGVNIGSVVTYDDKMITLNEKYFCGRAFDNRAGGFMIAEVARLLCENKKKLPFGLYIVNAVQEEIGLRGAEMISRRIKPDVAIVTDVCHDTYSPMYNKKEEGDLKCGKGPVLTYGPAVQKNLLKFIIDTAKINRIPYQLDTVSSRTGTDTDAFAYSAEGVASALISLPLKYMHTTVETVHRDDIENIIKLIYKVIISIEEGQDFRWKI